MDVYERRRPALKSLIDEIEQVTAIEIEVRSIGERRPVYVADAMESVLGVLVGAGSIVIEAPGSVLEIDDAGMAHELLHVRRQFIDRVPHLYPKKKANGSAASNIDNWLEHAVIYGPQMQLVPEMREGWNRDLQKFWSGSEHLGLDELSRRFNLLTRGLITERFGAGATKAAMREALQRHHRQLHMAKAISSAAVLLDNKAALLQFTLAFIGASKEAFWLRRVGLRPGENEWWDFDQPNLVHRG